MFISGTEIDTFKVTNSQVDKIYVGTDLVWSLDLIVDGSFDVGISNWTTLGGYNSWEDSDYLQNINETTEYGKAIYALSTSGGTTYRVTYDIVDLYSSSGECSVRVGTTIGGFELYPNVQVPLGNNNTFEFTATNELSYLSIGNSSEHAGYFVGIDNVSVIPL